jgi:hypothetical protein
MVHQLFKSLPHLYSFLVARDIQPAPQTSRTAHTPDSPDESTASNHDSSTNSGNDRGNDEGQSSDGKSLAISASSSESSQWSEGGSNSEPSSENKEQVMGSELLLENQTNENKLNDTAEEKQIWTNPPKLL